MQGRPHPDFLNILCGDRVDPDHVLGEILYTDEKGHAPA